MGNISYWWRHQQPTEIRIIYLEDKNQDLVYGVHWPETFAEFIASLYQIFPDTRNLKSIKFIFQDGCDKQVCVCSQSTFDALVPKHKKVAPTVDVYYVCLEEWRQ